MRSKKGCWWAAAEDATLREMVGDGYTAAEIGDEIGRSRSAVIHRMRALGVRSRAARAPDAGMRSAVLDLLTRGVDRARSVALMLGKHPRTGKNILARLARDGLARRVGENRSSRWVATKRWTDSDGPGVTS